ncbi:MAG: hypothetical protein V1494_00625 [Candidatus Diapherotrites archaeon]
MPDFWDDAKQSFAGYKVRNAQLKPEQVQWKEIFEKAGFKYIVHRPDEKKPLEN